MQLKTSWWFIACFAAVYAQNWIQIPGGLKYISASVNYVWGVNSADQIWRCANPCTGQWVQVDGALKQIDAGDLEVWGVNSNDDIYMRTVDGSSLWTLVSGKLKHVTASGNGYIRGVNSNDDIFKCKKPCTGSGWVNVPGKLKQIDGGYDYVYGVNSNNDTYTMPVDGSGSWRQIPGIKLKHVTASGAYSIFGTGPDDTIWRCKKPCVGEWEKIDGGLMQCDATINNLYGVNSNDNIYRSALGL